MQWTFRGGRPCVPAAAFLLIMLIMPASPASAQTASSGRRWQLEGIAGLSLFDLPTGGTSDLPPAGAPLTTSGPINPSRRVSTWFLGDGSQLLNGVNAEFGVVGRIAPLDTALASLGLTGNNASAFGLRIRRVLSDRLALELSADMLPGSREVSPELTNAVEAARASFVTAFTDLLMTGPFTSASVAATASVSDPSSRDVTTTVAAQWTIGAHKFSPYVTVGAGLVHRVGELPSMTLTGTYRFNILSSVPISETDTLHLRYEQGTALVGVVGAGMRRTLSDRLGFSIDGRLLVGQQTLALRLDSEPTVVTGSPEGFIESFTTPAIQFSNSRTTGRESSLTGAPLQGFKAFSTTGLQTRYIITAGLFVKF